MGRRKVYGRRLQRVAAEHDKENRRWRRGKGEHRGLCRCEIDH